MRSNLAASLTEKSGHPPPMPENFCPLSIKRLKNHKTLSPLANLFLAWSEPYASCAWSTATKIIPLSFLAFLASSIIGTYLAECREDSITAVRKWPDSNQLRLEPTSPIVTVIVFFTVFLRFWLSDVPLLSEGHRCLSFAVREPLN